MQNLSIFDLSLLFFFLILLKKTRKSVCSFFGFVLLIINQKMILKELLGLANLFRVQVLCIYKVVEVVVVCEYKDFMFTILWIMLPSFKNFNNGSQKLTIMNLILCFSQNYLF